MNNLPPVDAVVPFVLGALALALFVWLVLSWRKPLVVYEWHWALLFRSGKFMRVLKPGLYRFYQPPCSWMLLDKRVQLWSAPVHPVGKGEIKNIDEVKKDRKRLEGFLTQIKSVIPPMPPASNIDDQAFKGLLERTVFQLV